MAKLEPQPDGCWLWGGPAGRGAYHRIMVDGRLRKAHRFAYEAHHGAIQDGLYVCHRCDEPGCCNPAHLFVGTHHDNMMDRDAKGRREAPRGSLHANAKLTERDVREIRASSDQGKVLASRYGLSTSQISNIRTGKQWAHVR